MDSDAVTAATAGGAGLAYTADSWKDLRGSRWKGDWGFDRLSLARTVIGASSFHHKRSGAEELVDWDPNAV